jgi:poly(3-hydroxybutyrate) depolymerase
MSTTCPPSFEQIAFTDGIASWATTVEGLSDWWAAAIRRGATPPELIADWLRWWGAATDRGRPAWTSRNVVVLETPQARLRDFSTSPQCGILPTLVLPPQAGHDSCIVDYAPEQSQMRTILAAGLTRAYALEWIGATAATRGATIDDYLDVIEQAIDHIGDRVNLIGDCQGGWLATIFAALHPELVNTLTIAGAPIDFHAGEPVIHAALRSLAPGGNLAFYRGLVAAGGGVLRGEHMLAGFIAIKPDTEIARQLELLGHLDDPDHLARYREFEDWFKHTQAIPGAFYLWIVEHLFRDNELITGELRIGGERVELGRIECPLNLLAGSADHITPPDQVFALADYAGTAPGEVVRDTTAGGHLGLFMGHEALSAHWPALLAGVRARSG